VSTEHCHQDENISKAVIITFLLSLPPYAHAIYSSLYFWNHYITGSGSDFTVHFIVTQHPGDMKPYVCLIALLLLNQREWCWKQKYIFGNICILIHKFWGMPHLPAFTQFLIAQWSLMVIIKNWFKLQDMVSVLIFIQNLLLVLRVLFLSFLQ
jgi:hypothetical protein